MSTVDSKLQKQVSILEAHVRNLNLIIHDLPESQHEVVRSFGDARRALIEARHLHALATMSMSERMETRIEKAADLLEELEPGVRQAERQALLDGGSGLSQGGTEVDVSWEQKNNASLERSIRITNEAIDVGVETTQTLQSQGEQLKRAHHDVKRVDQMMDQADYLIRGIKSWTGSMSNWFRKMPTVDIAAPGKGSQAHGASQEWRQGRSRVERGQHARAVANDATGRAGEWCGEQPGLRATTGSEAEGSSWAGGSGGGGPSGGGGGYARSDGRQEQAQGQLTTQEEQNLKLLSQNLAMMKQIGLEMNGEIAHQNEIIEALDEDTGRVGARVDQNNRKMKRILGK